MTRSIWMCYALGQFFHAALQLRAIAKAPNNPASSFTGVLRQQGFALAARIFICTMGFLLVSSNPDFFLRLLSALGLAFNGPVPTMSAGLAGIFGYFGDSLLSFIPGLHGAVPKVEPVANGS